jgi:flagellin-like hook-associated protein FlgL
MQTSIDGLTSVVSDAKGSFDANAYQLAGDHTVAQTAARSDLDAAVQMLNVDVAGHYLFGGREVSKPPVASADTIVNGAGGQAGFNQVVSERKAADLGTGTGRLAISQPTATSVTVASDAAASPFGFKIAAGAASSSITGATVTVDPAASSATFALSQQPVAGDTVSLKLSMPDGTTTDVQLVATTQNPPDPGEFTIGASVAATTANLSAALNQAITTAASTDLVPASAMAAASDFFDSDPPQRVDIPAVGGAAAATGLRDGSADTVAWYQGEDDGSSPRATQAAKVDSNLTVAYGARADEDGPAGVIKALAVMSVVGFGDAGDDGPARNSQLVTRVNGALIGQTDLGPLGQLASDMTAAEQTVSAAQSRQHTTTSTLQSILADTEGADPNTVAASLLQAQTQLQASYQVTSMLSKLSLVNFLS